MRYFLSLAIIGCLAIQLVESAPSDKVDCSKVDEVLDEYGGLQGMTTLNDKLKFATTEDGLTKRCQEMSDSLKTLRKYNRDCFSSLTQQIFSAIISTRVQFGETYCKAGSPEFAETLKAAQCIQNNAFDEVKEAEKKIILLSQVVLDANIADEKLRLRRSCCSVLKSKTVFIEAIKPKCSAHEKAYADYVDSYSSEAMSLICPEAEKLECGKLEELKIDGIEPKTKFFLNPMLKLVKTLDH